MGNQADVLSPPKPNPGWVVDRAGPDALVHLYGEIDSANAGELESFLGALISDGVERAVLDFQGVQFIDSSGLRVCVSAANRLGGPGARCVRIVRASESVRRTFDATGLTHFFRIDHSA